MRSDQPPSAAPPRLRCLCGFGISPSPFPCAALRRQEGAHGAVARAGGQALEGGGVGGGARRAPRARHRRAGHQQPQVRRPLLGGAGAAGTASVHQCLLNLQACSAWPQCVHLAFAGARCPRRWRAARGGATEPCVPARTSVLAPSCSRPLRRSTGAPGGLLPSQPMPLPMYPHPLALPTTCLARHAQPRYRAMPDLALVSSDLSLHPESKLCIVDSRGRLRGS